jgi:exonuclease VII large subunit
MEEKVSMGQKVLDTAQQLRAVTPSAAAAAGSVNSETLYGQLMSKNVRILSDGEGRRQ